MRNDMTIMRAVTEILREHWNGRLPIDPQGIAESLGVKVRVGDFESEDIAGVVRRSDGSGGAAAEIIVNAADGGARQNFTIAHELGHLYLGHLVREEGRSEPMEDTCDTLYRSSHWDERERDANRFAAALLMPRRLVGDLLAQGVTDIVDFARVFGVSKQAMKYRLLGLGLF